MCVKFSPSEDRHLFRSGEGWPAQIVNKLNSGCLVLVASFLETRRNASSKQIAVGILEVTVSTWKTSYIHQVHGKNPKFGIAFGMRLANWIPAVVYADATPATAEEVALGSHPNCFSLVGCGEGDFHTSMAAPPKRLRGCLVRASSRVLLFLFFLSLESYEQMSPPFKVDGACFPSTDFISWLHYIYIYTSFLHTIWLYNHLFHILYIEINIDIQYIYI